MVDKGDKEIKEINNEIEAILKDNPTPDDDTLNYMIYRIFKKMNDDIKGGD
jgi:hypothetical protein